MIRQAFFALTFIMLGAATARQDFGKMRDDFAAWWNSPTEVVTKDFFYFKKCDDCHHFINGSRKRSCCEKCGSDSLTPNVRARKIYVRLMISIDGWQTADGKVYVKHDFVGDLPEQFRIGKDIYDKFEVVKSGLVSLKNR